MSQQLLEALDNCNVDTLAEITRQIQELQAEIDLFVAAKEKRIASLRKLRDVVDIAVNGPKPKKVYTRKSKPKPEPDNERDGDDLADEPEPNEDDLRRAINKPFGSQTPIRKEWGAKKTYAGMILDHLGTKEFSQSAKQIAADLKLPTSSVYPVLNDLLNKGLIRKAVDGGWALKDKVVSV